MIVFYLCMAAFGAGFIDAVVGGGGLIQVPALLINLPKMPFSTLSGTGKFAGLCGTSVAAVQYAQKIRFHRPLLLITVLTAMLFAYFGALCVRLLPNDLLKPLILLLLVMVFIYTLIRKDFGQTQTKNLPQPQMLLYGGLTGILVGFYDGFFGPGTGSFLVLFFIVIIGFDFLQASAHAKVVNVATNFASLVHFIGHGDIIWQYAIPMAVCNLSGNFLGAKAAILKGNAFVRLIFLFVIAAMIVRYAFEIGDWAIGDW
jgi:uncharacterized protein